MSVSACHDPVAVVGMACRLPGAKDLDEFWKMLVEGRDAIVPIPEARFRRDLYYHPDPGVVGKSYCDLAALVDYPEYTSGNSVFSDQQIAAFDLPHLALCETAIQATRFAKIPPEALRGSCTGVYVGHVLTSKMDAAYSNGVHIPQVAALFREIEGAKTLAADLTNRIVDQLVRSVRAKAPSRRRTGNPDLNARRSAELIAAHFGLDGPQMVFNAACASSLQALTHAIKGLELGKCDTAIVGGASFFHCDSLILFSVARSLSRTGSYPFTDDADGLIVGEGYVTFVLKRLSAALRDGNPVLVTLPGVGVSCDGQGKSLWAPRQEGQVEAIRRAYAAGLDMSAVQYVEAHATSTSLGDKTELAALCEGFADRLPPRARIPVGSVKLNIGHTLEVAGLAGLLKVVLAMKHAVVPPSIQPGRKLNSSIDWNRIPFFVPDRPVSWDRPAGGAPRRAAVEAFGIGGLNVHLVVDDFPDDLATAPGRADHSDGAVGRVQAGATTREEMCGAIAIVGAGLVVPGTRSLDGYSDLIREGTSQRKPLPAKRYDASLFSGPGIESDWAISLPEAGVIDDFQYDWRIHRIPPKQIAHAAPLQFMVLDAVDQALHQYATTPGGSEKDTSPNMAERTTAVPDRKRVGCIVGTEFAGEFSAQLAIGLRLPEIEETLLELLHEHGLSHEQSEQLAAEFGRRVLSRFPAILDETGSFTASSLATRVTKTFDFMGAALAVDALEPSVAALSCCSDMLHTGACDLMLCVGGQQGITPEAFQVLELSGCLAPPLSGAGRSTASAGMQVPGEGCVALVLKRLDDAQQAGDRVLGVIRGIGFARGRSSQESAGLAASRAADNAGLADEDPPVMEAISAGTRSDYTAQMQGLSQASERNSSEQFGLFGAAAGLAAVLRVSLALGDERGGANFRGRGSSVGAEPCQVVSSDKTFRAAIEIARPGHHSYHVIVERGLPVIPESQIGSAPDAGGGARSTIEGVVHFDATAVRRAKMRATAAKRGGARAESVPTTVSELDSAPVSKGEAEPAERSPLERPGVISLAPMTSVALSPSPHGPTVPAAQHDSPSGSPDDRTRAD